MFDPPLIMKNKNNKTLMPVLIGIKKGCLHGVVLFNCSSCFQLV